MLLNRQGGLVFGQYRRRTKSPPGPHLIIVFKDTSLRPIARLFTCRGTPDLWARIKLLSSISGFPKQYAFATSTMAPTASARSNISTRDANVGACASYAFQDSLTRANLAFDGIYILGGLIILVAYIIQAVRKGAVRKAAPWYLFGIGILLWTL